MTSEDQSHRTFIVQETDRTFKLRAVDMNQAMEKAVEYLNIQRAREGLPPRDDWSFKVTPALS